MWRIIACIAALLVEIEAVTGTQEPPPRLFGLKFYRTFGQGTKSIVVSPYSLCSSLTQTAQLAGGQSAAELLSVLGLSSVPLTDMIAMTDDLNLVLRKDFNKDGISYLDPTVIFANASEIIFLKSVSQVGPHQSLQEILHGDTVITPNTVHRYIAQRTDSNIHIQVPPDTLGANILLVVNAMVIHAEWEEFFYRHKTYRHRFIGLVPNGLPDRRVEMMSDVRIVQWKRDYKLQVDVVEVPLRGRDLVFLIVLPLHTQGLPDVEKAILENADALICLCQDLAPTLVRLGIPKFRVQTSLYMKAGLGSMGVVQAFDPDRADFSHLSASTKFYVSNIIHAAAIDVNEEGISPLSVPPLQFGSPSGVVPPEQSFIADHPFLFFIKHKSLDQVLTIGKYVGP